jgi:hypothetical protein
MRSKWRLTLGLVFYRGLRLYPYRIDARIYADLVSNLGIFYVDFATVGF